MVLYRVNLIERIGLDRVEWLEGPHAPLKMTAEALRALRDEYRAETRAIDGLSEARVKRMRTDGQTDLVDLLSTTANIGDVCGK